MARFLILLVFATLFHNSLQSGCQTVRISGSTTYQTNRMTTYTMTGQNHDGRPVYQSSRGDYLYYATSDSTWNVGSTVGSTTVGMYLGDTSYYADDTSGTWYLAATGSFQPDSGVSVTGTCSTGTVDTSGLSTGAIVGIVVGVFALVVVVVGVLCCVLCCAACKKGGAVASAPHNVSHAVPAPSDPPPMYSGPGYPPPTGHPPPPGDTSQGSRGPSDTVLIVGLVRLNKNNDTDD
ncbi:uncharacterized protein LOC144924781 isoform X1 [Branchiostoma floridae x Branchiostoma belcheri]